MRENLTDNNWLIILYRAVALSSLNCDSENDKATSFILLGGGRYGMLFGC